MQCNYTEVLEQVIFNVPAEDLKNAKAYVEKEIEATNERLINLKKILKKLNTDSKKEGKKIDFDGAEIVDNL